MMVSNISKEELFNYYKYHVNCCLTKHEDMNSLIEMMDLFKKVWFNEVQLQ